jgi:hypothetical protein
MPSRFAEDQHIIQATRAALRLTPSPPLAALCGCAGLELSIQHVLLVVGAFAHERLKLLGQGVPSGIARLSKVMLNLGARLMLVASPMTENSNARALVSIAKTTVPWSVRSTVSIGPPSLAPICRDLC